MSAWPRASSASGEPFGVPLDVAELAGADDVLAAVPPFAAADEVVAVAECAGGAARRWA
jgi:hypothetical protein